MKENPQLVGARFVGQYFNSLCSDPQSLNSFYHPDAKFLSEIFEVPGLETPELVGIGSIQERISQHNNQQYIVTTKRIICHETTGERLVIQVIGSLSLNGQPSKLFVQSLVLTPYSPGVYLIFNDVFRFVNKVFYKEERNPVANVKTEQGACFKYHGFSNKTCKKIRSLLLTEGITRDSSSQEMSYLQTVGKEYVRQFTIVMNNAPQFLYRIYQEDSVLQHQRHTKLRQRTVVANGRKRIRQMLEILYKKNYVKVIHTDFQETHGNEILLQILGSMAQPNHMSRPFVNTVLLGPQFMKPYYLKQDILIYLDQ